MREHLIECKGMAPVAPTGRQPPERNNRRGAGDARQGFSIFRSLFPALVDTGPDQRRDFRGISLSREGSRRKGRGKEGKDRVEEERGHPDISSGLLLSAESSRISRCPVIFRGRRSWQRSSELLSPTSALIDRSFLRFSPSP